jgi:hypothetical protein
MSITRFALSAALLAPCALVGCGPTIESVPVQTSSAADEIKKGLEEIAKTGEVGSSVEDIRMNSGKLSDQSKVTALRAGLDELAGLKDPAKIKAKAEELIKGL